MAENIARLLLYNNEEFFAEKSSESIRLLGAEFTEEEIPEEALKKKALEAWGVEVKGLKLLCVLPKNRQELVQYFACREWDGSFDDASVEEIVSLSFEEALELSERTDALAVQVLGKVFFGKEFERKPSRVEARPERPKEFAVSIAPADTADFEVMPAVPKGMGKQRKEPTREGIDYEFLSKGAKPKPIKTRKTII